MMVLDLGHVHFYNKTMDAPGKSQTDDDDNDGELYLDATYKVLLYYGCWIRWVFISNQFDEKSIELKVSRKKNVKFSQGQQ